MRYNVYRSASPGFTPSPGNAIALGVTGLTFADQLQLVNGAVYYYVVRAEDSTSSGGGIANGGNEDGNLAVRSGVPQGPLSAARTTGDLGPAAGAG